MRWAGMKRIVVIPWQKCFNSAPSGNTFNQSYSNVDVWHSCVTIWTWDITRKITDTPKEKPVENATKCNIARTTTIWLLSSHFIWRGMKYHFHKFRQFQFAFFAHYITVLNQIASCAHAIRKSNLNDSIALRKYSHKLIKLRFNVEI